MENTEPTITLTGDMAQWLIEESERAYRAPQQHAEFLLRSLRKAAERRKAATEDRKRRRAALDNRLGAPA